MTRRCFLYAFAPRPAAAIKLHIGNYGLQSLTFDLSPPVLYELGLDEAVNWLIEQLSRTHPAQIVYMRESLPEKISDDIRFVVFTAARELLTNALKHSGALRIDLSLGVGEGGIIRLTVRDDGRGFDAGEVLRGSSGRKNSSGGFGLFNVKERITFMGGMLRIDTAPGLGTSAELVLPLNTEE